MNFNNKLKKLRNTNNETQQELADKLNVSFQSISKWEKGICLPSIAMMKDIAAHYNVTLDSLLQDEKEICRLESETHTIKFHPTINKESFFSIYLDKDKLYPSMLCEGRYRTDAYHQTWASNSPNNYVIAVNSLGNIIYMAYATGHSHGSPCDPFYHPKDIVEASKMECFYILDTYTPFGDGTMHYIDYEFIIPKDGFIITVASNSFELKAMFEHFSKGDNPEWIDFRRFKPGELDSFKLTFQNNTLLISYQDSKDECLEKTINDEVFERLFNQYLERNKAILFNKLKDQIIALLQDRMDDLECEVESAFNLAQEAFERIEEVLDKNKQ